MSRHNPDPEKYITEEDLAAHFGCSIWHLRRRRKAGMIDRWYRFGRTVAYRREDIAEIELIFAEGSQVAA